MTLSTRITTLNADGSDGWEVFHKARAMVKAGEPVIELTIGEHDINTHPDIIGAMHRAAVQGHTGYPEVPGISSLRQRVAQRIEQRTGVPTRTENILITPGGQAGLFASHLAVCNPGDTALYVDPYYATYPGTIRSAGARPKALVTSPKTQFQPDTATLDQLAQGAKSLLINTPNNPTGVVYSRDTLEGLSSVCKNHDLWLISDEVYDTQIWEGQHLSPRALPQMDARTLVVGSMSKSHAMTGSRVGWICGPAEAIHHLGNLATNTTYGVPGYIQDAAEFALNQGTAAEQIVSAPFQRRREMTLAALRQQNVIRPIPAQGGMYVMMDIRSTGMSSGRAFAEHLLEQEKIAVMPGESFGKAAAGHIRVAMTVEDTLYQNALDRLMHFAASL